VELEYLDNKGIHPNSELHPYSVTPSLQFLDSHRASHYKKKKKERRNIYLIKERSKEVIYLKYKSRKKTHGK
jgi:hypothetical protein